MKIFSEWQQGEAAAFDINQERMHCELLGEKDLTCRRFLG
jgi:hypothetical protein